MKKVQKCTVMGNPFYCYILCWLINGLCLEYWFAVLYKETIDAIMEIIKVTLVVEFWFQDRKLKFEGFLWIKSTNRQKLGLIIYNLFNKIIQC